MSFLLNFAVCREMKCTRRETWLNWHDTLPFDIFFYVWTDRIDIEQGHRLGHNDETQTHFRRMKISSSIQLTINNDSYFMKLKRSKQIQSGRSILIGLNGYSINGKSIYIPMSGTNCIALIGWINTIRFRCVRFGYLLVVS